MCLYLQDINGYPKVAMKDDIRTLDDRMLRLPAGRWSIDVCFPRGEPTGVLSFNAKRLDTMEQCECFSMAAAVQWLEGRLSPTKSGEQA